VTLFDTVGFAPDQLIFSFIKVIVETFTTQEIVQKTLTKPNVADSFNASDIQAKDVSKPLSDTQALSDTNVKDVFKVILDN
jgi:hypothetical protein